MSWPTSLTDDGLSMLNRAVAGETITFTKAYATSATMYDGDNTPYVIRVTCPVVNIEKKTGYTLITVRITNAATRSPADRTGAFNLTNIYLYAKVGNGSEKTFCRSSHDVGTPIPAVDDDVNFKLDIGIPVALSNTATVNAVIPDNAYVTLETMEARIAAATAALESKISILERNNNAVLGWMKGFVNGTLKVLGRFVFTIQSDAWTSFNGYWCYHLSGAAAFEYPFDMQNADTLAFALLYIESNDAEEFGIKTVLSLNAAQSAASSTGYVCGVTALANTQPNVTVTGECIILAPQYITDVMESEPVNPEEEETEVEYLNNEITDVSVSGNKVTATVTYIGSGRASLRYKYKSVTKYAEAPKGRGTYTCNLNESYTNGNSVTITLVKDGVTLATATYPDIDEPGEAVTEPDNP